MKKEIVKNEKSVRGGGGDMSAKTSVALGYQLLNPELVRPSPTNPRKYFNPEKLKELADSIAKQGVIQPLVVRYVHRFTLCEPDLIDKTNWHLRDGKNKPVFHGSEKACREQAGKDGLTPFYELVAGERRLRGSKLAKLAEVPCVVKIMTDEEALEVQQLENLQREDLTAIEEAEGFQALLDSKLYTVEKLMEKLSVSRSHIFGRLKLLKLSKPIKEALREGKVDTSIAGLIAQIPDPEVQAKALKEAINGQHGHGGPMSFRNFQELLDRHYMKPLKEAAFDAKIENLVAKTPACEKCPKRSGNMTEMFPNIGSPHVCTDTVCFGAKTEAHFKLMEDAAVKNGQKIMSAKEFAQVEYSSAFIKEDDVTYVGNNYRKWGDILKSSDVKWMLGRDKGYDGEKLVRLLPRAVAFEAAKKLGVTMRTSGGSSDYERKQREEGNKKRKMRVARNKAVQEALPDFAKALPKIAGVKLWRLLADCALRKVGWGDAPPVLRFMSACGMADAKVAEKATKEGNFVKQVESALEKLKSEDELRVATLCLLMGDEMIGLWDAEFSDTMAEASALCGIDLEKLAKAALPPEKLKAAKGKKGEKK